MTFRCFVGIFEQDSVVWNETECEKRGGERTDWNSSAASQANNVDSYKKSKKEVVQVYFNGFSIVTLTSRHKLPNWIYLLECQLSTHVLRFDQKQKFSCLRKGVRNVSIQRCHAEIFPRFSADMWVTLEGNPPTDRKDKCHHFLPFLVGARCSVYISNSSCFWRMPMSSTLSRSGLYDIHKGSLSDLEIKTELG